MALEYLKKLFPANEDGTPKAMTFEELEAAITADKGISLINLKDGGYVAQDKFDRKQKELEQARASIETLNSTITKNTADLEELQKHHHWMHDFKGQYDDFIAHQNGERIYFFRNGKEYMKWVKEKLLIENIDILADMESVKTPIATFFEDNGQTTTCFDAECIKHPDNPCYDKSYAEENVLNFIGSRQTCSPGMLIYMLEHRLLPDAMFNDIRGRAHGRRLMQGNIEFLARCMRRDIETQQVFYKRTDTKQEEDTSIPLDRYHTKLSYDDFIDKICEEDTVQSKARKEWKIVDVDEINVIVRDIAKNKEYEIRTRDLDEAHLNLNRDDIQIATVAPFVGKGNAPAASALLYNIVGRGELFNNLRKNFREIFKKLNLK